MERTLRLLIVDDEQQILDTYQSYFKKRGFEVELANDGAEGLQKLRQGEFDVAIVDIQMPKMDGLKLAEQAITEGIDTSLIILTGHGDKEEAIRAINSGVQGWFEKATIKMDTLLQKVVEVAQVMPLDEVRRILSALPKDKNGA